MASVHCVMSEVNGRGRLGSAVEANDGDLVGCFAKHRSEHGLKVRVFVELMDGGTSRLHEHHKESG